MERSNLLSRSHVDSFADRGFSFLELMIVLSVSTILLSAFLLTLNYIQLQTHDISLRTDRDIDSWVAPLLLVQWIAGAGNNRWNHDWNGVTLVDETALFKSDADGKQGFPDDELSSSYEDIAIRHRQDVLAMRSGLGSFQPVLRGIHSFEPGRLQEDLLIIKWSSRTRQSLRLTGRPDLESAELKIHLWNYRKSLFGD